MSIGHGFQSFIAWKDQSAWGTKATGLTKTMSPIREGRILDPNVYRTPRGTVVQAIPTVANLYNVAKLVPWRATMELINPRTANDTIRSFLRAAFGKEVITTVGPFTKKYTINDPLIDGGTDTATDFYGRALTIHHQVDNTAGVAIFADEVQDAVVNEVSFIFEPDMVTLMRVSGMASDILDDQSDITPVAPTGLVHTWEHVRGATATGLRVGTANPPVFANDNVIFQRATLTLRNNLRYRPQCGLPATQQARIATRQSVVSVTLDVVMDVEDQIAGQWDYKDAKDQFVAGTAVNVDLISQIASDSIFEFKASGATAAGVIEKVVADHNGEGAMTATATVRLYPAAIADLFVQLTTVDV